MFVLDNIVLSTLSNNVSNKHFFCFFSCYFFFPNCPLTMVTELAPVVQVVMTIFLRSYSYPSVSMED